VAQVQRYVLAHLGDDLTVAVLAKVANMSERSFARIFASAAKVTPAEFVERARLDAARVMLESGDAPLKTVAYQCGFHDAHRMRAVFLRRLSVTPQQYRTNFGAVRLSASPGASDLGGQRVHARAMGLGVPGREETALERAGGK
jgi:transcriptional regulator GlxA family with amidase domain